MDINVNLKVTFDETPALLNCLAALAESLQRICAVTAEPELLPANPPETGKTSEHRHLLSQPRQLPHSLPCPRLPPMYTPCLSFRLPAPR